ncbi:MAG: FAD binding domain-containing protein [Spirochaetales bacterium]|nr:FAD binding domain-containing protein [Spirochaetales bacterium]
MVSEYLKPKTLDEALSALADAASVALAGGTWLLVGEEHGIRPDLGRVVDVGELVSALVERKDGIARIGAGATFQAIADSPSLPDSVRRAALSMANRNTRNRATLGGNLGADKSCASLVPVLLALDASVEYAVRSADGKAVTKTAPLAAWLDAKEGLVLAVAFATPPGLKSASGRASRTACDVATATVGVAYRLEGGAVMALKIAMGGFGPHARRMPKLEALFEGKALPSKAEVEKAVEPLLGAISDQRGSADYKRRRGAVILADALAGATEVTA